MLESQRHADFHSKENLELADEFIRYETKDCTQNPVEIEWVKGDTTETINNLKTGDVDIGITYNTAAELNAIKSGFAHGCNQCLACESCQENNQSADMEFCGMAGDCSCCESCHDYPCYSFRDHFYLVGPNENLDGEQRLEENDSIVTMFSKIYVTAEAKNSAVRFLSRYDKSATNIKDSELWIKAGQVSFWLFEQPLLRWERSLIICRYHGHQPIHGGIIST